MKLLITYLPQIIINNRSEKYYNQYMDGKSVGNFCFEVGSVKISSYLFTI